MDAQGQGRPALIMEQQLIQMPNPRTIEDLLSQYTVDVNGCWVWVRSLTRGGYGQVWYRPRLYRAHRLSYMHHVGPIPAGLDILHKCDNPPCINPDHLYPGTKQDNSDDMVAKGRHRSLQGEANPRAKLTEAAVQEIRKYWTDGMTQKAIAPIFGVDRSLVSEVLAGKRWAHVS